MCYTYVLENEFGDFYTGYTADFEKRLAEHQKGKVFTTKNRQWRCIYYEACMDEQDARRREKYPKTTQGRRMFKLRNREYFFGRRAS